MRTAIILSGLVLGLGFAAPALADDDLTSEEMHDNLDDHGAWVETDDYGLAWRPEGVGVGWRPYSRGYWERVDNAWLWCSSLSWGRIPFHYGRWLHHARFGWVWIPGRTYAPAWVVWSDITGYSAWAPLPPGAGWRGRAFVGSVPTFAWVYAPSHLFSGRVVRFGGFGRGPAGHRFRSYRAYGPGYRGRHAWRADQRRVNRVSERRASRAYDRGQYRRAEERRRYRRAEERRQFRRNQQRRQYRRQDRQRVQTQKRQYRRVDRRAKQVRTQRGSQPKNVSARAPARQQKRVAPRARREVRAKQQQPRKQRRSGRRSGGRGSDRNRNRL